MKTSSIEDKNGRGPQWKNTSMEDNLDGKKEDNFNGRWPQRKTIFTEADPNEGEPQWKTNSASIEDNLNEINLNEIWPQLKVILMEE